MNGVKLVLWCAVVFAFGLPGATGWAQFGGERAEERAKAAKEELQSAIGRAEGMMASQTDEHGTPISREQSCLCVGDSESETTTRIHQALAAPLRSSGLDFVDTPLEEVVSLLQEDYGFPVQLDLPALEDAGLGPDEPVTINLHNISLRSALRLMLKRLQLTYIIQDEMLLVTTPDVADSELSVCVYDVGELLAPDQPKAVEALIDVIICCAATDTWQVRGGDGEIRPLPPSLLVISQTHAVHEEIRGLLAAIREMRAAGARGRSWRWRASRTRASQ